MTEIALIGATLMCCGTALWTIVGCWKMRRPA